jgi:mono/diheme cytochrome c family protein
MNHIFKKFNLLFSKIWLFVGLTYLLAPTLAFSKGEPTLTIVNGQSSREFKLSDFKKKLKVHTIELDDPVFKKRKSFDGFLLTDIFKLVGFTDQTQGDEIVLTALDGYAPSVSFDLFRTQEGYVVFQETGTKLKFGLVAQGKAMVSPGPFYIVWKGPEEQTSKLPWAYQLAVIELVQFSVKYAKAFPPTESAKDSVMRGFKIFKSECIRCHSINLSGGDIGPELNAPQNVTEYMKESVIRGLIKNAESFRYRSKMPAFPNLKDEELDDLIDYLKAMKKHKITL